LSEDDTRSDSSEQTSEAYGKAIGKRLNGLSFLCIISRANTTRKWVTKKIPQIDGSPFNILLETAARKRRRGGERGERLRERDQVWNINGERRRELKYAENDIHNEKHHG
jgi:hypothetical protein